MTAPPPAPAQPELELELETAGAEHRFQVPSEGVRFAFHVAGGSATGFALHQGGQTLEFQRSEK
jgi:hypothetical protein